MSDRRAGKKISRKAELQLRIVIFFAILLIVFLTLYNRRVSRLTAEQERIMKLIDDAELLDQAEQDRQAASTGKKKKKLQMALKTKDETVMTFQGNPVTKEDIRSLCRIVEAEATGLNENSRLLVANVVLNRMRDRNFPDTITDVIFESDGNVTQFSPVSDGRYYKVRVSGKSKRAVARALSGEDRSKGALYFMARKHSSPENVRWFDQELTYLFKYEDHEFFR